MERMEVACFFAKGTSVSQDVSRQAVVVAGGKCHPLLRSGRSARGRAGLPELSSESQACAAAWCRCSEGMSRGQDLEALTILNAGIERGLKGRLDSIEGEERCVCVAKLGRWENRRSKSSK